MAFDVLMTEDAVRDLEDICDYIALHDALGKAEYVLGRIEKAFMRSPESLERGSYPKELLALGSREYREVFFKPYRIIYKIAGGTVYVLLIVDGRRDMQSVLQKRLLEA